MPARIVWLGDASRTAYAAAYARCDAGHDVRICRDADALETWSRRADFEPPDFVVLASPLASMWSPNQLRRLIDAWPLVRWIELLGDWRRHDVHPSPEVLPIDRIRVEEFSPKWIGPKSPTTATHAERLLEACLAHRNSASEIVYAAEHYGSDALLDWVAACGYSVRVVYDSDEIAELPGDFRPALLIVDVPRDSQAARDWAASIRARFPDLPCLGLVDFPGAENAVLGRLRVDAVVRKTSSSQALTAAIERAIAKPAEVPATCR